MAVFNLQLRQGMSQRSIDRCHLLLRNLLTQPGSRVSSTFASSIYSTAMAMFVTIERREAVTSTGGIDSDSGRERVSAPFSGA
jgi:hypothetical protein